MFVPQSVIVRKAFTLAKQIGIDVDDRIDLTHMLIPGNDITSWKDLTDEDAMRLCDAMEGFLLLTFLLAQRRGVDVAHGSFTDLRAVDGSEGEVVGSGVGAGGDEVALAE